MKYQCLTKNDIDKVSNLMEVFAVAFEDQKNYSSKNPSKFYLQKLLSNLNNIVLVAMTDEDIVVGGIVAYELQKFEQERSEIYLYDLAVLKDHRRQGIATRLIEKLKMLAKERNAKVIFVQADNIDKPAVALYTKLASSAESDITHFDIPVDEK